MAIAHICHDCGVDLARIRARREPHYGLMLVTCPGCGRAAVRRLHPLLRTWRTFRRLDWAVAVMVVQLIGLALFAAVMSAGIGWFTLETVDQTWPETWRREAAGVVLLLGVWPVVCGAWLTVAFWHWRRTIAWLVFAAIVLAVLGVVALAHGVEVFNDQYRTAGIGADSPARVVAAEALPVWWRSATLLYMTMVLALAGVAPGRGARWLLGWMRRGVRRWRRRRSRLERMT